jgi:hypothetical protein
MHSALKAFTHNSSWRNLWKPKPDNRTANSEVQVVNHVYWMLIRPSVNKLNVSGIAVTEDSDSILGLHNSLTFFRYLMSDVIRNSFIKNKKVYVAQLIASNARANKSAAY